MKEKVDIAIIGAGVIGLCSAYYLRKAGYSVQVFDRVSPEDSSGCSYINCGYVTPSHFIPLAAPGVVKKGLKWMFNSRSPLYIKPRLNSELIQWLWHFNKSATQQKVDQNQGLLLEMNLRSRDLYQEMHSNGLNFKFGRSGLLTICSSEKGMQGEIAVQEAGRDLGLEVEILDGQQVLAIEPEMTPRCIGGSMIKADGHLQPIQFMNSMKSWLSENDVKFHWGEEVTGIESDAVVKLGSGEQVKADRVVIAGGSWSNRLTQKLGVKLPLQAGKGYSMTIAHPAQNLRHPTVLAESKIALTPFANSLRVGGTMELSGVDLSISQNRVKAIQDATCSYLPKVKKDWFNDVKIERGLRPVSPDGMPYIGRISDKVIVATGHAMLGMSLGPLTGEIVEALISESAPFVKLNNLSPLRFS